MKKITLVIAAVAVFGMVAVAAWAGNNDKAKVGFSIEKYFSMEIKTGDSVEFGTVDADGGAVTKKNGTTLEVESNTSWNLTAEKAVVESPDGADDNTVLNALTVSLETTSGTGKDSDIKVDYTLDNLEDLPSGDYVVEVTFTGSTK